MAVTIITDLPDHSAVYNPMEVTVSSTNVANTRFKFMFEIYDVSGPTLLHTFKVAPRPDDYGRVDIHRILESQVSQTFDIANTSVSRNDNDFIEYRIEYGEEYEVAGVLTEFPNLTTGTNKRAINASLTFERFVDTDIDTDYYNDSTGTASKFLTNSPASRVIRDTENSFIHMTYDNTTGVGDKFNIKTYDSAGVLNGEFRIDNPFDGLGATRDDYVKCNAGPGNINDIPAPDIFAVSGATPIIDADVASYTIEMESNGFVISTETKTYVINRKCSRHEDITLHFLNEWGGFDSKSFIFANIKTWEKEQRNYKVGVGSVDALGALTYSKANHQQRAFWTRTQESLKLTSDWISEEESIWLRELFDSPVIYMEKGGELIAIHRINESSYRERNNETERLFNLEVNVSLSAQNYRQRW